MPAPTRHALTPASVHFFTPSLAFSVDCPLFTVHCYLFAVFQITLAVLPPLNRIKPQGLPDFFCARKNQTALVFINW